MSRYTPPSRRNQSGMDSHQGGGFASQNRFEIPNTTPPMGMSPMERLRSRQSGGSSRMGSMRGQPNQLSKTEFNFPTLGSLGGNASGSNASSANNSPRGSFAGSLRNSVTTTPVAAKVGPASGLTAAEAAAKAAQAEVAAEQEAMEQAQNLSNTIVGSKKSQQELDDEEKLKNMSAAAVAADSELKEILRMKKEINPKYIEVKPLKQVTLSGTVVTKIIQHCKQQNENMANIAAHNSRQQQVDQSTTPLGGSFTAVSGQLIGIDSGSVLEITDSFALYSSQSQQPPPTYYNPSTPVKSVAISAAANAVKALTSDYQDVDDEEGADYLRDMLQYLELVNFDANPVGWYLSTNMGTFWSHHLLDTQYKYQKMFPQAVLIVHDTTLTDMGNLNLRAFRLSDEFIKLYENNTHFTVDLISKSKLDISTILEVVPITISNTSIHSALLQGLDGQSSEFPHDEEQKLSTAAGTGKILESISPLSINNEILDLGFDSVLEKQLENVMDSLEIHDRIQRRYQAWTRRVGKDRQRFQSQLQRLQEQLEQDKSATATKGRGVESEIKSVEKQLKQLMDGEPNRLETLIIVNQIASYCNQITQTAGPALTKMYITKDTN